MSSYTSDEELFCLRLVTHTRTHNRLMAFCTGLPGRPVLEETFTRSHPSWSLDILYQLPPFATIHSILFVHFTCLTVLFDNLSSGPLWSCSWSWILYFILHAFVPRSSSSFCHTCPYHHSLFCCNTSAMSFTPNLSLSSLLGNLSFSLTSDIHLTILVSARWSATTFSFLAGQVSLFSCHRLVLGTKCGLITGTH